MVLQPLLLALKGNSQVKYEKNLMILPVSSLFFNIEHNLAQILSQDHTQIAFFAGFQWSMLGNSINIKNEPKYLQVQLIEKNPVKIDEDINKVLWEREKYW